ncbi:uncharacterized protein MELLADRAFT_84187 [Melampsora larici-populina 98AG31]|uniref:Secreted protein n=1 Tax=Melampsora larici-populina (strain 98AG31 / pathotype 3-4-7) TaxID=747676 RepID=F4SBV4_MELLP|nr:uncharacterized protein MELLADRAFT_84187 [Melampsora larici-populina 98AG31]EGF97865.1 secreted protein [Melampsora larici-populina 98AG31]
MSTCPFQQHILTITLTLALIFACVGYNNAVVDYNDYITPLCCTGNDESMQCRATTSPRAWWSQGNDCTGPIISDVACKDGRLAGYSTNSDGSASWVTRNVLAQRFGQTVTCYLADNQCYNGQLRCRVPDYCGGSSGLLADSKAATKGGQGGQVGTLSGDNKKAQKATVRPTKTVQ